MIRHLRLVLCGLVLGACATPGQVKQVESQVALLRADQARADSVHARRLTDVLQLQQRILDSLGATSTAMRTLKGDVSSDLYNVQQQLVQLQELTGQSQRRLSELRTQLETRGEQIAAGQTPPSGSPDSTRPAAAPSADQIYEASLQQLRRGSAETARAGLRQLLSTYPTHERAPDATYFIGQSFSADQPDSAAKYYQDVVTNFPQSARAPSALYNLGLLAERKRDTAAAKDAYNRVIKQYPRSDEAALARDRLRTLGR